VSKDRNSSVRDVGVVPPWTPRKNALPARADPLTRHQRIPGVGTGTGTGTGSRGQRGRGREREGFREKNL
ncbi:hypothetical protein WDW37_09700, partial [Bdellovibrionota bacterium FG-1]